MMRRMFLSILLVGFFACKKNEVLTMGKEPMKKNKADGIWYNRIERMPVLKECYNEDLKWKEIKECSDKILLETIYSNLKKPSIQPCSFSMVVLARFTIHLDGTISKIEFLRPVPSYYQEEATRLIQLLPCWQPANFYGKDIAVKYTIPIRFGKG